MLQERGGGVADGVSEELMKSPSAKTLLLGESPPLDDIVRD